jgi:hypothetical protein
VITTITIIASINPDVEHTILGWQFMPQSKSVLDDECAEVYATLIPLRTSDGAMNPAKSSHGNCHDAGTNDTL